MNKWLLDKADMNCPKLFEREITTDKTVKIIADETNFFGASAVAEGVIPAVLKTGDRFTLDFGDHCVGYLSFRMRHVTTYLDAPVRLKLRFGEIPYELYRDFDSYHGSLSHTWLQEEIINLDDPGRVELPRRYAFRYLEVTVLGTPRDVMLTDFAVRAVTSADWSNFVPLPAGTDEELVKIDAVADMVAEWADEIVAIGVRHKNVLAVYKAILQERFPDRTIFVVTGEMSFAKRRALRKTLKESGNGILLCTQQSLPSSVNFEYVNKIIIPELHYNNARMSQFYMRFIRYTSTEWKDIYFVTYAGSIESNLMQMVLAKEKINMFMKGQDADLNEIYDKFGVDYDLLSLLMRREQDEEGHFHIRWGEQKIA